MTDSNGGDKVVPLRRSGVVKVSAAPEPMAWEILVTCEELGWNFSPFGIPRSVAPTEEEALDLAVGLLQQQLTSQGYGIQELPGAVPGQAPAPCPECGGERHWERLPGGGLDAVCACGRRGAHDDG